MKGAIEVLRNVRAMCSQRDNCIKCPLDNRCCPGINPPELWTDEIIYTMVGLPRYDEVNMDQSACTACHFYSSGRCNGQKWAPVVKCGGDRNKCEVKEEVKQ